MLKVLWRQNDKRLKSWLSKKYSFRKSRFFDWLNFIRKTTIITILHEIILFNKDIIAASLSPILQRTLIDNKNYNDLVVKENKNSHKYWIWRYDHRYMPNSNDFILQPNNNWWSTSLNWSWVVMALRVCTII